MKPSGSASESALGSSGYLALYLSCSGNSTNNAVHVEVRVEAEEGSVRSFPRELKALVEASRCIEQRLDVAVGA